MPCVVCVCVQAGLGGIFAFVDSYTLGSRLPFARNTIILGGSDSASSYYVTPKILDQFVRLCSGLFYCRVPKCFTLWQKSICMRSMAWLAASVWLRLARLPPPASRMRRSRRLRDTAAPGLLAHASVTEIVKFSLRVQNLGTPRYDHCSRG